jgi:hypothetical protein
MISPLEFGNLPRKSEATLSWHSIPSKKITYPNICLKLSISWNLAFAPSNLTFM